MSLSLADLIGGIVSFSLTLFVLSYLVGDNKLFRLAIAAFIGVSAGYVGLVAWQAVVWPRLLEPLWRTDQRSLEWIYRTIPVLLSVMLLAKLHPRVSTLGTPVMAFLVGVGVAAAIGGAIEGTLIPQVQASVNIMDSPGWEFSNDDLRLRTLNASVILISTIAVLATFQISQSRTQKQPNNQNSWLEGLAMVGKASISVAMGVVFTGALLAALVALVDRVQFLVGFLRSLLLP